MVLPHFQDVPQESLRYIIDHVFLPPQLPQSAKESDTALHDGFLLEALIQSLQSCGQCLDAQDQGAVQDLYNTMNDFRRIRDEDGTVNERNLEMSLHSLLRKGRSS